VRLKLASNISSFKDLRAKHDDYLQRFARDNGMLLPYEIWRTIVWPTDSTRIQLNGNMDSNCRKIDAFIKANNLASKAPEVQMQTVIDSNSGSTTPANSKSGPATPFDYPSSVETRRMTVSNEFLLSSTQPSPSRQHDYSYFWQTSLISASENVEKQSNYDSDKDYLQLHQLLSTDSFFSSPPPWKSVIENALEPSMFSCSSNDVLKSISLPVIESKMIPSNTPTIASSQFSLWSPDKSIAREDSRRYSFDWKYSSNLNSSIFPPMTPNSEMSSHMTEHSSNSFCEH